MSPPAPAKAKGAEIFAFSVRDPAVAAEVDEHLGNRVTLTYEPHLGLPSASGRRSTS